MVIVIEAFYIDLNGFFFHRQVYDLNLYIASCINLIQKTDIFIKKKNRNIKSQFIKKKKMFSNHNKINKRYNSAPIFFNPNIYCIDIFIYPKK